MQFLWLSVMSPTVTCDPGQLLVFLPQCEESSFKDFVKQVVNKIEITTAN